MKLWLSKTQLAAHAFWTMREARERKMLLAAAAVILAALCYLILFAPALAGREKLQQNLPSLREQVAQLQALSGEAASLNTQAITSVAAMTLASLNNTLSAHGLKIASVNVTGEIAQVQLSSVSFSATLAWLDELQKTARISVTEAKITALAQPDQVDASFTLRQNGNP